MPVSRGPSLVPVALDSVLAFVQTPSEKRLVARNAAAAALSVAPTGQAKKRAAPVPAVGARHVPASLRTPPVVLTPVVDLPPPPPAFSPGAIGRSVATAMAPLFELQASAKKLKVKAAPGDLSAPKWLGELEVVSQPDKLTLFEAARAKYVATCKLSDYVPTPLHEAFDVLLVPTLRRWLGMPKGTALCSDWVSLVPDLDDAIMPLLKNKFVVVSAMSLRASLKALRIRPFSSSWLDLNRAFDAFSARWDVAVFEAQRHGVVLPSPDLADILKAACAEVPCLADVIDGRQDDVLPLRPDADEAGLFDMR
jgi:hypothetical protein